MKLKARSILEAYPEKLSTLPTAKYDQQVSTYYNLYKERMAFDPLLQAIFKELSEDFDSVDEAVECLQRMAERVHTVISALEAQK